MEQNAACSFELEPAQFRNIETDFRHTYLGNLGGLRVTLAGSNISGGISSRLPRILRRTKSKEATTAGGSIRSGFLDSFLGLLAGLLERTQESTPAGGGLCGCLPSALRCALGGFNCRNDKLLCLHNADVLSLTLTYGVLFELATKL